MNEKLRQHPAACAIELDEGLQEKKSWKKLERRRLPACGKTRK